MKLSLRNIIIIVFVIFFALMLYQRDRVAPALAGLRAGYVHGYGALQEQKTEALSGFDKERANIKTPKGAEGLREAFKDLGYTVTIVDYD